ncbi:MAG: zinc-ribbon domain-containing protein [Sulfolobus sp.]
MVKYCPKCGYPNPDEAMYCVRCGIPLATIQPQSQLAPQQQINNPQQAPQYQQTTPKYPQQQYQTSPSSLNSIKPPQQTDYVSFKWFTFDKENIVPVILTSKDLIIKDTSIPLASIISANYRVVSNKNVLGIGLGLSVLAVSAMAIILSIMFGGSLNLRAAIFAILLGTFSVIMGFRRKIALINIIYQGGQLSIYNKSASEAIIFVTCLNKAKMGEFNCTKGL